MVERTVYCEWFDSPVGDLAVIADDTALLALQFRERTSPDADEADIRRQMNADTVLPGNVLTRTVGRELEAFFAGRAFEFSVPLAPAGSEFEQKVWAELLRVPLGETCSYGDIARNVGGMETVRAVGKANGANPIAIIIPCHRCIGSDGSLTGYGGGLWRKKWLLRHEGRMRPIGLFAL